MGDGIEIKHNVETFVAGFRQAGLMDEFRLGSSRVKIATKWAIVDTLKYLRTQISSQIRKTYNVQKQNLDAAIKIRWPHAGKNQAGSIAFSKRHSLPLSMFDAKETMKKGRGNKGKSLGISVQILKGKAKAQRKIIRPGGIHHIYASWPSLQAAVWLAKGHVMARVDDKDHPVILYGPSFMSFFTLEGRPDALQDMAAAKMENRLKQHLKFVANKSNLTNFGRGK